MTTIKKYKNDSNKSVFPIFHILKRIDNLENLEKDIETKNRICKLRKRELEILKEQNLKLLDNVHTKASKLDCLDEIENMGFNYANLKKLKLRLTEIAVENKMNQQEIIEEYFDSIPLFADKITARKELERLNKSVDEFEILLHNKRSNYVFQRMAGKIVQDLVNMGMDETAIIMCKEFIDMMDEYGLKPKDVVEFIKWVNVYFKVVTINSSFNKENLKIYELIKSNNSDHQNIRQPYPFCKEENRIIIFDPLLKGIIYSIPNN